MPAKSPVEASAAKNGFTANLPADFIQPTNEAGRTILKAYGAVFVARGGSRPPNTVFFKDQQEVASFQAGAGSERFSIGDIAIELQPAAMTGLKAAIGVKGFTPRGTDAARRSYQDTVGLWVGRVENGLKRWGGNGRLSADEARRIKTLSPVEQIPEIFKLEEKGIFFSTNFDKPIMYSVAPPGSSQHLSMLALDVEEHGNAEVRAILARHGWFQTVVSDEPHFTFLGVKESELPGLGLKQVRDKGRVYWVPDI